MTTFDTFLVATAGIHDTRGKNLEARKREELVWALTELCVRSFPGAGKAQFEITYRLLALALTLGTTVRIGCHEATVKSMEPEDWVGGGAGTGAPRAEDGRAIWGTYSGVYSSLD